MFMLVQLPERLPAKLPESRLLPVAFASFAFCTLVMASIFSCVTSASICVTMSGSVGGQHLSLTSRPSTLSAATHRLTRNRYVLTSKHRCGETANVTQSANVRPRW